MYNHWSPLTSWLIFIAQALHVVICNRAVRAGIITGPCTCMDNGDFLGLLEPESDNRRSSLCLRLETKQFFEMRSISITEIFPASSLPYFPNRLPHFLFGLSQLQHWPHFQVLWTTCVSRFASNIFGFACLIDSCKLP